MREINFRGKRIDNGEWTYGNLIVTERLIGTECYVSSQTGIDNGKSYKFSVNPPTVGQYTGLTDKNEKRIYEGDILMSCGETLLVVFSDTRAGFVAVDKNNVVYPRLKQAVVIGNIHDDPILWEVK